VERFPLVVVGVLESFAGPGIPILLCRATDERNTGTGPVAGMSGSPVYVDGRLAGAYAYGFPWSKGKTLIGVTPIEWMNPLLGLPDRPYRETQGETGAAKADGEPETVGLSTAPTDTTTGGTVSPRALPIPLLASGVSERTLRAVDPWLRDRGIRLTAGAAGSGPSGEPRFGAGSPLAVILASGDLTIGGVGTITRRKDDRFLAFGHPMLGAGSVELPVGGAEIVDVVSSYRRSFKLSNIGEVAGTMWQDSTPGIQGELGRIPYMIPIRVSSDVAVGSPVTGRLAEHRRFTPVMALLYAARTLLSAEEGPADATVRGTLSLALEGREERFEFERRGVGMGGAMATLFSFADYLDLVLNGSQEFPRIEDIAIDFRTEGVEKRQILRSIRLDSARIRAGEPVHLTIQTRRRDGSLRHHRVEIPLPEGAAGESFSVFVADADALRANDQLARRDRTRSLDDLLAELRQLRGNGEIHVQLLRDTPGLRLAGRNLESLPPSVLRLYRSPLEQPGDKYLRESVVWETSIPVPGVFAGSSRLGFQTEP
jgi:hypothetical protein